MEALVVPPPHIFESCRLDFLEGAPRTSLTDRLGLVQPVDGLSEVVAGTPRGHVEGLQRQDIRLQLCGKGEAHIPMREGVRDEVNLSEDGRGGDIGHDGDPELARRGGGRRLVDQIRQSRDCRI